MITRRTLLAFIAVSSISPALAAEHPSISFMKRFGKDMLAAHRLGTVSKFAGVIDAYADVAGISNYSLGQYKPNLRANQRSRYYQGVVTFMSRYFAEQSREYRVAKYEIGEATVDDNKDVIVASKMYPFFGQTYKLRCKLQ